MSNDLKNQTDSDGSGTVIRGSHPLKTKEKGKTAFEIAEAADWEVKEATTFQTGDFIDDNYMVEKVYSGGMGHVFITWNKNQQRRFAIKQPNSKVLSNKNFFSRVLHEADTWTNLGLHPNIAHCYFIKKIEGIPYIFIEYADGGNLRDWIADGKCIGYKAALDIAIQFCHGMEHAHRKGMIHRDIKPENILMTRTGGVKVTDFGLAGITEKNESGKNPMNSGINTTQIGDVMGTQAYMSPEQWENPHLVDEKADIFSFGVCLWEMLCGNRPYKVAYGDNIEPMPDPLLLRDDLPESLAPILKSCVALKKEGRPKSFTQLRNNLNEVCKNTFHEDSEYFYLELQDTAADELNNQGYSFCQLGKEKEARACFEKALILNSTHAQAVYNLSLLKWRSGEIDDLTVINNLSNCGQNPKNKGIIEELLAYIHLERFDIDSAKSVLTNYPDKFEELFKGEKTECLTCHNIMEGHQSWIKTIAINSNGEFLLTGSADKTIKMWDLRTGQIMHTMEGHAGEVICISISKDDRVAVSGGQDKTIRIWDLKAGLCTKTLEGHTDQINSISISADGKYVVSGSADKTIKLWDLRKGSMIRTFEGHLGPVITVKFGLDEKTILSGSLDRSFRIWDISTGSLIRGNIWLVESLNCIAISPDEQFTITGSGFMNLAKGYTYKDNLIRCWDNRTGNCLLKMEGQEMVMSLTISTDGKYALTGGIGNNSKLWRLETGQCMRTAENLFGPVNSISIYPAGIKIISGSTDHKIKIWQIDLADRFYGDLQLARFKDYHTIKAENKKIQKNIHEIESLIIQKNYKDAYDLLQKTWEENNFEENKDLISLYNVLIRKGKWNGILTSFITNSLNGHTGSVNVVTITPDGKFILSGSEDNTVRIWDRLNGDCIRILNGHTGAIHSLEVSPDGKLIVTGSADNNAKIWEFNTGRCIHTLEGNKSIINILEISPDGKYLVTSCGGFLTNEAHTNVWDLQTGKCIHKIENLTGSINDLAITPDGSYLVAAGDQNLQLLTFPGGAQIFSQKGNLQIKTLALSSDGRNVVTGGALKDILAWNLQTGRSFRTLKGHTGIVNTVCVSRDEKFAFSGSSRVLINDDDNTIRFWDLQTGECLKTLHVHSGGVKSIFLSRDNQYLISGSNDKTVKICRLLWNLEFPEEVDQDKGIMPYLINFLHLRGSEFTKDQFDDLFETLQFAGYGYVQKEGILNKLEDIVKDSLALTSPLYSKETIENLSSAEAVFNNANQLFGKGEYAKAINEYTEAIRLFPDYALAFNNRGACFENIGNIDSAIKDFSKAIELDSEYAMPYSNRGRLFFNIGKYNEAISDCNQTLRLNSNDDFAFRLRGMAYAGTGKYNEAINDYDKSLKLNPNNQFTFVDRGIAYYNTGNYAQAINDYSEAIRIAPNYAIAINNRGVAYQDSGNIELAFTDFSKAIDLDPHYAVAYRNRGRLMANKGKHNEAILDYNQSLILNSGDSYCLRLRGMAYAGLREYDKAVSDYNKSIALNSGNYYTFVDRGLAFNNKGDYDKAISDYTEAIKLAPSYAIALNNRGASYENTGNLEMAIRDFTSAIELNPQYALPYRNRGRLYFDKKDFEKSIQDLNDAIKLNGSDRIAYYFRGLAFKESGNISSAVSDLRKAGELGHVKAQETLAGMNIENGS